MSEHRAEISWSKKTPSFSYTEYNREHKWQFDNEVTLAISNMIRRCQPLTKNKESKRLIGIRTELL